jgi:hypothetical protein
MLSGMGHVKCWELSNILANIAVAIFGVNVYWLGVFLKTYIEQAVHGK